MKLIKLGSSYLRVTEIALGCMRMADITVDEAAKVIQTALDCGINFFDHADMYGNGKSEKIFAAAIKKLGVNRKDIIIQSKCGIDTNNGTFDFSKDYILKSVEGILERLETDYLDVLVLHRPDALMEVSQVNEAFSILHKQKKVRHFGVSNQSPLQMELLRSGLDFPLETSQVQFSLKSTGMLDFGFNVNMENDAGIQRGSGILEYAQIHKQTIQAWSPFFSGFFESVFIDNDDFLTLNKKLDEMAEKYDVAKEAIAVAWILRHPASMQVLVGSMTPRRIEKISKASDIKLSHTDWYDLYKAAGNQLP
jgi:predicted oxidoreductase